MIHLAITFLCLIYIIYTSTRGLFSRKKKENAHPLINNGILCYHCKDLTTNSILEVKNKITISDAHDHKLCKKCVREKSISKIVSSNFIKTLIVNFRFFNWCDKRVLKISYLSWFVGLTFFIIGRSLDGSGLNSIAMLIYCLQIWLMNTHFNSLYVDEGNSVEKLNELK